MQGTFGSTFLWHGNCPAQFACESCWNFLFREKRVRNGPTVLEFWGEPQLHEAKAMSR